MKKEELRIGNIISRRDIGDDSERIETIIELKKDKALTSGPIDVICSYENLEPIPLTEEWLLNFGFVKHDKFIWKYFINETLFIFVLKGLGNIEIGIDINNQKIYQTKKYVHQLQNLYFSLTEKELQTKLPTQ